MIGYFKMLVILIYVLSFLKQRLNDKFVQNIVGSRIQVGHYIFYKSLCSFRFQSYLICVNIIKRIVQAIWECLHTHYTERSVDGLTQQQNLHMIRNVYARTWRLISLYSQIQLLYRFQIYSSLCHKQSQMLTELMNSEKENVVRKVCVLFNNSLNALLSELE